MNDDVKSNASTIIMSFVSPTTATTTTNRARAWMFGSVRLVGRWPAEVDAQNQKAHFKWYTTLQSHSRSSRSWLWLL